MRRSTLTGDLIYCAYNGIDLALRRAARAGMGLHKSFGDLLLWSEHQMTVLDGAAGEILPDLSKVFRFLRRKENIAITFLNNAASKAATLSAGMTKSSEEYRALGELAQSAVEMARSSTAWSCSRSRPSGQAGGHRAQTTQGGPVLPAAGDGGQEPAGRVRGGQSKWPSRRRSGPSRSASSARSSKLLAEGVGAAAEPSPGPRPRG